MRTKALHPILLLALSLHTLVPAKAFQVADGARPAFPLPAKYIFYWGKYQCDLTEANGYKNTLALTAAGFRQILLSPPSLWNGARLEKNFTFQLEGTPVNTAEYTTQVRKLYTTFGLKAEAGQVLHLTALPAELPPDAAIDLRIVAPEEALSKPAERRGSTHRPNFTDGRYLEQVVWGREDAYDLSNRDFFTLTEMLQTIRQTPFVAWQPYVTPQGLFANLRVSDAGQANMSFRADLDQNEYPNLLAQLEHYWHLFYPGSTVELSLHTASYDQLFQKTMTVVDDNDPRLALRRNRDLHQLTIHWAMWEEKIPELYLARPTGADGRPVAADMPVSASMTMRINGIGLIPLLLQRPECRVDGEPVNGLSFRLSGGGRTFDLSEQTPLTDSQALYVAKRFWAGEELLLDSFRLSGYELPPITFYLRDLYHDLRLHAKNDLPSLLAAVPDSRLKLLAPSADEAYYFFDFDVPERVFAHFGVFEPGGLEVASAEDFYAAGANTIRIAKANFKTKGKHHCFLNTPLGVARVDFEVE